MSWQAITVSTQNESVEAVSNILMEAGAEGIQIDDAADRDFYQPGDATVTVDWDQLPGVKEGAQVSGYFPSDVNVSELMDEIRARVQGLTAFGLDPHPGTVKQQAVQDEDWATEWQKYYHPVRLTRYLTVVPKWEGYQPESADEHVITLDPGMAFGTGTHPTTRLMLQAEEFVFRGHERVLDVGTGSGVLSIAAKYLGADYVLGTDVDEVAVRSTQGNLDLNPVAKDVHVQVSDLLDDVHEGDFDIVIANMLAEVLLPLIPQLKRVVKPGTQILLSGIYQDKLTAISTALQAESMLIDQVMQLGEWYGVIAHVPSDEEL
ncbi:ribosomal protein L11 methyltransferase [Weissella uvarum]|uniref:50S ribosomal protein L11 methyltransferase n=1 Tax=Weissella uvarum TaxID=1479233 RepID=UPI00195F6DF0|nr:50S ribosomal protein L11 methyltransferase [Weissella uvarum]MBM7617800.1 ribosomal protein L11 methyltransferase [Weissella uvarum]MCM0595821.1 50S ribosomal protein L11 methyltransferase [Weissella uvarum]